MKNKKLYPLTLDFIKNHPEESKEVFLKIRPHKGVFIGACELDGCFLCEAPHEIFDSLEVGEKLLLSLPAESKPNSAVPLEVKRDDGVELGSVPFQNSVLPCVLMSRGINVFCYLEAKELKSGLLSLAVSVYCEKY